MDGRGQTRAERNIILTVLSRLWGCRVLSGPELPSKNFNPSHTSRIPGDVGTFKRDCLYSLIFRTNYFFHLIVCFG